MKLQSELLLVWVGSWSKRGHPPGSLPLLHQGVEGLPARARPARPARHSPPQGLPGFGGREVGDMTLRLLREGQGKLAQTPSGWAIKHDSLAAIAEVSVGWGQRVSVAASRNVFLMRE